MFIFDKNTLLNTKISNYGFFCFVISEIDYINILKVCELYFKISLLNKETRIFDIKPFIYMVYKLKHFNIGNNPTDDKNTTDILGKEFKISLQELIYNPKSNNLYATVKLKKNWTCIPIPHIMISNNSKLEFDNNSLVNNIDLVIDAKLCFINNSLDQQHLYSQPDLKPNSIPNSQPEPNYQIKPKSHIETKSQSQSNNPKDKKIIKQVPLKPPSKQETEEEIIIMPDDLIYYGRNGAKYKIINGKKRYLKNSKSKPKITVQY